MTLDTLSIYEAPVSTFNIKNTVLIIYVKSARDIKAMFLLLSVYGLARQEESQDYRHQVSVFDHAFL